jgi:hypothetical protein
VYLTDFNYPNTEQRLVNTDKISLGQNEANVSPNIFDKLGELPVPNSESEGHKNELVPKL